MTDVGFLRSSTRSSWGNLSPSSKIRGRSDCSPQRPITNCVLVTSERKCFSLGVPCPLRANSQYSFTGNSKPLAYKYLRGCAPRECLILKKSQNKNLITAVSGG
jgi:hypothetical protein